MSPTSFEHKMIVRDYYSRRAFDYDKQKTRSWKSKNGFSKGIIDRIIEVAREKNKGIAIEVGVGSGRISHQLVKKTNLSILGLDLSKNMIELAKSKMHSDYSRMDLLLADLEHLPFKSATSDFLFCISTLHYLDSPLSALQEFSRVLRLGGVFTSGEVTMHEMDTDCFLDRLEKAMSPAHGKYYRPSEMKGILEKNGFHVKRAIITQYRKPFRSLIEDKANYFGTHRDFNDVMRKATVKQRKLYDMSGKDLELNYLLVVATKGEQLE